MKRKSGIKKPAKKRAPGPARSHESKSKTAAAGQDKPKPENPKPPPPPPRNLKPRDDENADAARRRSEPSNIPLTKPSDDANERTVGRQSTSEKTLDQQVEHLKGLEKHHDVVRS